MKKSNSLPYLPEKFKRVVNWLKNTEIHPKIIFFVLGILSTLWFLIRVIPKPSRAAYPCMQATAPYMSAFVLWLTGIAGSAFSLAQLRKNWAASRYVLVFVFLLSTASFYLLTEYSKPQKSTASNILNIKGDFPPNDPIGIAQGIFPGRVVWNWNPAATNENCDNTSNDNGYMDEGDNAWFMESNNNISVIDSMLSESLLLLTGTQNGEESWEEIFHFFNQQHGNGDLGYEVGEKIFLKINATTAYGAVGNRFMRT